MCRMMFSPSFEVPVDLEALHAPPSALLLHFCLLAVHQITLKEFAHGNIDASKLASFMTDACLIS